MDGKCKFCGASQKAFDRGEGLETHAYAFIHTEDIKTRIAELFGGDMQFDVIIGNPPYQLDDGASEQAPRPSTNCSFNRRKLLTRAICVWLFLRAGSLAARDWTSSARRCSPTIDSRHSTTILAVGDVFPGVGLKGGVCYFLWDRENPGRLPGHHALQGWPLSTEPRGLLKRAADVFIRFNEGLSILKKVVAVEEWSSGILATARNRSVSRIL